MFQERWKEFEIKFASWTTRLNETNTKMDITFEKTEKEIKELKEEIRKQKKEKPNIDTSKILVKISPSKFESTKKGEHPKKFLKEIQTYFEHRRLKVKDVIIDFDSFKNLFLKHFFSEQYQWEVFLKCTEARKAR